MLSDGAGVNRVRATVTRLADGRALIYYDRDQSPPRGAPPRTDPDGRPSHPDRRDLGTARQHTSEVRMDRLRGEHVGYAAHRQHRTHLPPAEACPLCPSGPGRDTEIPAPDYQVVVFENRFPSFAGDAGRCEVICFSPDHRGSFAELDVDRAALVLEAWTDRTAAMARQPGVRQVYCFENRGAEIGVTLAHPHGQIYGYPELTPHTAAVLRNLAAHRASTGRNLADELLRDELRDGRRVVFADDHWVAFVPYAARWPYEVHLYPRRRQPDLRGLTAAERFSGAAHHLRLLRGFDLLFGPGEPPTPYISGWHQAPFPTDPDGPPGAGGTEPPESLAGRAEFPLHLELFTVRRAPGKLKHLAGSESGMGAFVNDVLPEEAAARLREVCAP